MIRAYYNQEGYTLIEAVMVIVILGIIGVITIQAVASGVEVFVKAKARKELYDQGRLAMERMIREISVASQITHPTEGNSDTYTDFTKASYGYPTGSPGDSSTSITYQLNGTTLERVGDISGTFVLASSVSSFQVTHLVGNYVRLELAFNSTSGGTISMRTILYARNVP